MICLGFFGFDFLIKKILLQKSQELQAFEIQKKHLQNLLYFLLLTLIL